MVFDISLLVSPPFSLQNLRQKQNRKQTICCDKLKVFCSDSKMKRGHWTHVPKLYFQTLRKKQRVYIRTSRYVTEYLSHIYLTLCCDIRAYFCDWCSIYAAYLLELDFYCMDKYALILKSVREILTLLFLNITIL